MGASVSIYIVLMRATVAVVADDLTGAADTGAGFVAGGLATVVTWADQIAGLRDHIDADAIAIDMESRAMSAGDAGAVAWDTVTAVRLARVPTLYKKCDSLLRGHIGIEVKAALEAWHDDAIAVVSLAFPAAGRTTVGGRQHVNGVAIGAPPIASFLEQAGIRTANVDLASVRGPGFDRAISGLRAERITALVCDAESDEDLRAIAAAGAGLTPRVVWVGSGGLARALPVVASNPRVQARAALPDMPQSGAILAVIGSRSAVARRQSSHAAVHLDAHVEVDAGALLANVADRTTAKERMATVTEKIVAKLETCSTVLVTIGGADLDSGDGRIAAALGDMLTPVGDLVAGLVVTGGDTATSVLRGWGTTALHMIEEVEPGMPLSVSAGARTRFVVTKAGAFGREDSITRAALRLRDLRAGGGRR